MRRAKVWAKVFGLMGESCARRIGLRSTVYQEGSTHHGDWNYYNTSSSAGSRIFGSNAMTGDSSTYRNIPVFLEGSICPPMGSISRSTCNICQKRSKSQRENS
jgi:hypothetical protein